ncbi:MAG TPA: helix-turn-helix transcriptional regulator [Rubricoccaceae bacterium]|jgi:transcriptional regulator with XRE-family HTH domain
MEHDRSDEHNDALARLALARLGAAVRARRRVAGLSQEGLAERSDLHRNYVGGVERGERNVGYLNLLALARGLGCVPAVLVAEATPDASSETDAVG